MSRHPDHCHHRPLITKYRFHGKPIPNPAAWDADCGCGWHKHGDWRTCLIRSLSHTEGLR